MVMRRLNIPDCSMRCARKVFEDVAKAIMNKDLYDPHSDPRERGRNEAIIKKSREDKPTLSPDR